MGKAFILKVRTVTTYLVSPDRGTGASVLQIPSAAPIDAGCIAMYGCTAVYMDKG